MSKNLVIVESPTKAKTLERFLGKDYHVLSSQGHIRDIQADGKNSTGIDFEHNYTPHYVIDTKKQQLIKTLKEEADKADTVWLASDEDREGEAIAWHLQEVLGLQAKNTHRIVFHEITKDAILNAIKHPRSINYHLVNAQQARRVLDRIVGYELSPVLWRKITTGLSAGRVQSVAVRLIVEREKEIADFTEQKQYRITADFQLPDANKTVLHTELNHRFNTKLEAKAFLEQCADKQFVIRSITKKPAKRLPAPPFTTSSLQQEAARKLKFPVSKTMRLAQALYEAGKITYMRTDSVNLSSLAIGTSKQEIVSLYGETYQKTRQYHTSSKGAQEAHEAIRPTFMSERSAGSSADEKRLYELIWKRTLASQMADAELETTRWEIAAENIPYLFVVNGETVVFDGFMRVYIQSNENETEENTGILPQVNVNTLLTTDTITARQTFSKPPMRYNEATLVKKMEELGIGRPSTYASIIETIQSRKYVERGNVTGKKRDYCILTLKNGKITDKIKSEQYGHDTQKLLPTDLGRVTNEFLMTYFPEIMNYDFTANEEANFDKIAEGQADWVQTVDSFYKTFHPTLSSIPPGKMPGRLLGNMPATGEPVYAKISKIGPCIQIGDADKEKPKFVSLNKDQSVFSITLDEALKLYEYSLPLSLNTIDGKPVTMGEGKYGPYIKYDNQYISIPATINPAAITEEQVRTLIETHRKQSEPLKSFGDIHIMDGRYGAYIKAAGVNYHLPKNQKWQDLTLNDLMQIIEKQKNETSTTTKRSTKKKK